MVFRFLILKYQWFEPADLDSHLLDVGEHQRYVDNRVSKSPTSCLPQKETKQPPAARAWLPAELEEVRVLSYDFFSCLEGARCHHGGWGACRAVTRAQSTGSSRCGRSPALGGILSEPGNLGGQLFAAPTDVPHFFFFLAPWKL